MKHHRSPGRLLFSLPVVALMMGCAAISSFAQDAEQQRGRNMVLKVNDGDLDLKSAADLIQDPLDPKLGNGSVAVPSDWPASGISDGDCSATLIGAQVAITAAHCVGHGARLNIKNSGGVTFTGTCHRHPAWSRDSNMSPDVALCLMQPMAGKGLFFESLLLDPIFLRKGQKLLLGGYGCLDLETEKRDEPPRFRIGNAFIGVEAGNLAGWPNWVRTEPATSTATSFACFGDSGGAVYFTAGIDRRGIVAIISAADADKSKPTYKASYLAALATPEILQFIRSWPLSSCELHDGKPQKCKTGDGAPPKICGIDLGASKCRPLPD